ncbi:MAG: ABC transporter ATP-binding protein [Gammaproteobacteria bacterium]|jgi:ATP-binding cassette subfamily B protein
MPARQSPNQDGNIQHAGNTNGAAETGYGARNLVHLADYSRRAIVLVWTTHRGLTIGLGALTILAGVLPAGIAYVGQLIVDTVVALIAQNQSGAAVDYAAALWLVAIEGVLVALLAAAQRGIGFCQSLLRVLLSQRVHEMILDKAQTLSLAQFEDSEFYDKLNRARQEASTRPLSLVNRTFSFIQNGIVLIGYAGLLIQFSVFAVVILIVAGLPSFFAEAKFSGERFRVFQWRSPLRRMLLYLEIVLAREDHAKEVKLFNLGPNLMQRYRGIFKELYEEEKRLTIRRDSWGFALGLLASAAFYGAYVWVALATIAGTITLGQMTMYLMVFKQGQGAVSAMLSSIGGMYEDNLYLSNLYGFMEEPVRASSGNRVEGVDPEQGVVFENVSFTYPGANEPAIKNLSLTIEPGQTLALVGHNGSGKTTLVKLLAGLYPPDQGRITYQGTELGDWDSRALRDRIGVIFQDFMRYQLTVGENIGIGDESALEDPDRWASAAERGQASDFIEALSEGYGTQLGRWFNRGQELSGGQWQRIALARAFMREHADILVLDEPTSSMDAETEMQVFERFRTLTRDKIVILISHRFSTVRQADTIAVMEHGTILEQGNHEDLMARAGRYAGLFELQASAYR